MSLALISQLIRLMLQYGLCSSVTRVSRNYHVSVVSVFRVLQNCHSACPAALFDGSEISTVFSRDVAPCPTTSGKNLLRASFKVDSSVAPLHQNDNLVQIQGY